MNDRSRRITLRVVAIGLHWLGLTIALGSLVMRSDQAFGELITPHLGGAPVFIGAAVAGVLLGMTIESPKVLGPLVLLMCLGAASFVGIITYAPVFDGLLVRTTNLDNYVMQRVLIMMLLISMAAIPGAVAGTLFGSSIGARHEIAPHPDDLGENQEAPWWERRYKTDTGDRPA